VRRVLVFIPQVSTIYWVRCELMLGIVRELTT
jgi:hypothetical protein